MIDFERSPSQFRWGSQPLTFLVGIESLLACMPFSFWSTFRSTFLWRGSILIAHLLFLVWVTTAHFPCEDHFGFLLALLFVPCFGSTLSIYRLMMEEVESTAFCALLPPLVFQFSTRTAHGLSCPCIFLLPVRTTHGPSCPLVFVFLVRITHGLSCLFVLLFQVRTNMVAHTCWYSHSW